MALYWMAQAGSRSGPYITEGWAAALAVAGWVVAAGVSWWFNEDDPATPWDENEVTWELCDGSSGDDPGWPYDNPE